MAVACNPSRVLMLPSANSELQEQVCQSGLGSVVHRAIT